MKLFKLTPIVLLISCVTGFTASAAPAQNPSLPINSGIVLLLAIGLGLGIKLVSKKLKQVDRDLQDAFGEKIL